MTDDMLFCPNCGTEAKDPSSSENKPSSAMRPFLGGLYVLFLFFTFILFVEAFFEDVDYILPTLFCGVYAGMFYILSKTPKSSVYLFGKEKGINKIFFIVICNVIAFVLLTMSPSFQNGLKFARMLYS